MAMYAAGVSSRVEQLEKLSINLLIARADLEPVIDACLASASLDNHPAAEKLHRTFMSISTTEDLFAVLGDLAYLLSISVLPKQTWIVTPWTLLADLTKKEPYWRQLFGPLTRTQRGYRFGGSSGTSKGCILEAAVQVIQFTSTDSLPVSAIRPVLRLIANCCADNNVNRSLVISSPALDTLQSLVIKGTEMDILLPTLYNICTGFDEPALDENGRPYHLSGQLAEAGLEAEYLTMAEARLQIWPLMDIDDKSLEASGPILADLIEMSSRSALFDISVTLRPHNFAKSQDSSQRADILSHKILHQGTKIACTSTDAQASICQTCLNLYSQPIMQKTLAQSSKDIELFIEMPYLTASDQNQEDIDLSPYRESFLRQLYAVSALPEYQKLASPDSDLLTSLTQYMARCEVLGGLEDAVSVVERDKKPTKQQNLASPDNPSSLPSVLALLNNALCDLERVEAFLNHHSSVCKHIMIILLHTNTQLVMLPSLSLVNRLALSPTGAQKLYAVDHHFSVLSRLLKHKAALKPALGQEGQHEVPIQREIITFARLLIKSSPSIALALVQNPIYYNQLLHLPFPSSTTPDTASRSELARLNITLLRTIASSPPASAANDDTTSTTTTIARIATTITNPTNLPLLTSSLINFLLLAGSGGGDDNGNGNDGPTTSASTSTSSSTSTSTSTTEALFGLAIFTSIFILPSSPHHNPSVKPALLSRIIEDQAQIVNLFQNIAAATTTTTAAAAASSTSTSTATSTIEESKSKSKSKPDIENLQILLTHLLSTPPTTTTATTTATTATTGTTVEHKTLLQLLLNDLNGIATSLGLQFASLGK